MKILLVVDMQNDFIYGPLGNEWTKAVVPKVVQKIQEARAAGYQVVFTFDTHDEDYLTTLEGKHLPIEHCIQGTHGWELVQAIANVTVDKDICICKPTFGKLTLGHEILKALVDTDQADDYDELEIEIIGVCTDICVITNALILKTYFNHPENHVEIRVDASCCAGTTPENHRAALQTMKSCQIIVEGE